jgi:hypothetical protein
VSASVTANAMLSCNLMRPPWRIFGDRPMC